MAVYLRHNVVLIRGEEKLIGEQYSTYPVDEPPVVEVPSLKVAWYRFRWVDLGWKIEGRVSDESDE